MSRTYRRSCSNNYVVSSPSSRSELGDVVENRDLLAGLEGRQADVGAVGTAERVTKGTAATAARLALHGKVKLVQVLALELEGTEVRVGLGTPGLVFGFETLGETACAVLAGSALLARRRGTLRGC